MIHIRPIDPAVDLPGLFDLWKRSFDSEDSDQAWPVTPAWFRSTVLTTRQSQEHLIAEIDGQKIGFALVQINTNDPTSGSLQALAVLPGYRRQGIGRILHQAALDRLQARSVRQVQLGAGAQGYFWPGVPMDPAGAWEFFKTLGWSEVERSFDLICSLDDYQTPAWVWERVGGLGLELITADQAAVEKAVIDLISNEHPGWEPYYTRAFQEGRARDVLLARQVECAKVLGACLVESPTPRWETRLHQPAGAPGCLLTAQAAQNRGVGMALAARATEILRSRGCQTSFIGWTWLVDWYGKLGYTLWQEYVMSRKNLQENSISI